MPLLRRTGPILAAALLPACVIVDTTGPGEAGGFPSVAGSWQVGARVQSTSCGRVDDEDFRARIVQNGDIVQLVVDLAGFGSVRYDGFLGRDGGFSASHTTVFPDRAVRDESFVRGTFRSGGRSLTATETEDLTDLVTGRRCTIVWRWSGSRL